METIKGHLDPGILYSERPCASAAVFTGNKVKAVPDNLKNPLIDNPQ